MKNTLTIGQYLDLKRAMVNHRISPEDCVLYDKVHGLYEKALQDTLFCNQCARYRVCNEQFSAWKYIHTCFVPVGRIDDQPYENFDSKEISGSM